MICFCLWKSPKKNKNGSTFSFTKIGNTCIKIGISDLHFVRLPPIYIFQKHAKSNFIFVFERFECICKAKFIKKYLLDHWYFLKNYHFWIFCLQNHMFLTSETIMIEISNKNHCIHSKNSRNFCFYQIEPFRISLAIWDCKISLVEQLSR